VKPAVKVYTPAAKVPPPSRSKVKAGMFKASPATGLGMSLTVDTRPVLLITASTVNVPSSTVTVSFATVKTCAFTVKLRTRKGKYAAKRSNLGIVIILGNLFGVGFIYETSDLVVAIADSIS
jgi:hypothetical protein